MLAKHVFYQLNYTPFLFFKTKKITEPLMSVSGLEPESRGLKGRCSTIELYTPKLKMLFKGIEPLLPP
jgi:hypothetical protein